jgi:hypothetical protein
MQQFFVSQLQPGFDSAQGNTFFCSDLPLTHPFEKCELYNLLLRLRHRLAGYEGASISVRSTLTAYSSGST